MLYRACFLFFTDVAVAKFKGDENLREWHITRLLTGSFKEAKRAVVKYLPSFCGPNILQIVIFQMHY